MKKIFSIIAATAFLLTAKTALAELDPIVFHPQVGLPGFEEDVVMQSNDTSYIAKLISSFYEYGFSVAGILAAIMMMAGGVLWIFSQGESGKIGKAKELIIGGIIGLFLLFGSYLLLKTVNPDLPKLKNQQIGIIARLDYCCDPKKGNVEKIKQADGTAVCPEGSSYCENSAYCENVGSAGKDEFTCIDQGGYYCCEYKYNYDEVTKYCAPISIKEAAQGKTCQKYDQYTWKITHNGYCTPGEKSLGANESCISNVCKNKKDGDSCFVYEGTCWCYNYIAWYSEYGKEGEPCGNRGGSTCYKMNSCTNINGVELYSDHSSNARGCADGLSCCNTERAIF